MKRLLIFCTIICCHSVFATTYYWIGGAAGNWSTASNWSNSSGGAAASFYPMQNDAIIFDNGQTVTVNYNLGLNAVGFANFSVINNTQLILVNTLAANRSFYINSSGGPYFEVVQSGSSLTLKSNTNNYFTIGGDFSSGRMIFNGNLYCINQDVNTTYGPSVDATDSVIINNLFYIGPSNITAVGSNPRGLGKFRFASKAVYQIDKNKGIILGGKWEQGSKIRVTGTTTDFPYTWLGNYVYGAIEFDTPNASVVALTNLSIPTNAVFQGDFKITNLGNSAGIQFAYNPNFTINGDLIINAGTVKFSSGAGTSPNILIKGNYVQGLNTNVTF